MRKSPLFVLAAVMGLCSAASNAQTVHVLGSGGCSPHAVSCTVPIDGTSSTVWVDLSPYQNPTASRFITGIPELLAKQAMALVNLDATYQVTTAVVSYKAGNGVTYTGTVPSHITLTWVEVDELPYYPYTLTIPDNPLTGTATINLGHYTYAYTCSGRGCGGTLGWHWQVTGGTITVNQ